MKIGFVLEHFDPVRGGLETYVDLFARHLLESGHAISILAEDWREAPAGVEMHHIPRQAGLAEVWSARKQAGVDVLIGLGKHVGADIVIPQGGTYVGTIRQNVAMMRPKSFGSIAGRLNTINPTFRRHAMRERDIYAAGPHVIAVSNMVRDDLHRYYAIPEPRLHLVYNGCDVATFTPQRCDALRSAARRDFGIDEQTTCFLIVARNPLLKGLRELIDAAGRLAQAQRNFAVLVAGQGVGGRFRRQARRRGVESNFRFLGAIPEILAVYAAADAYVHPTWYDPCSLSVMEAWACARPVITTRFNGASELMTAGQEGFVIDTPANIDALADAMGKLLDESIRAPMRTHARALAENYSQQNHFAQVLRIAHGLKP